MSNPPFKVKAVYDYSSPHDDDLSFPNGQIITVTEEEDADWYVGEYTDAAGNKQSGLFPKNFVEKYEPAPPPRPVRAPRPKQTETLPVTDTAVQPEPEPEPAPAPAPEKAPLTETEVPQPPALSVRTEDVQSYQNTAPPGPQVVAPVQKREEPQPVAPSEPTVISKPASATTASKAPPPVAAKSSSFRDRIAAFNQPAAAPVSPFKPGAPSQGFIKKPFVAPPPSRDAYVPQAREPPPQKLYRREEDPEISERKAQDEEAAEKAGLTGSEAQDEDAPKPQSLKERIALLQKQQAEQAAKRVEVSHKEKPKRPAKKRTESEGPREDNETEIAEPAQTESTDTPPRQSTETTRGHSAKRQPHDLGSPVARDREPFSDGNDADQSAAGETTEDAEGSSTSVEDEDRPKRAAAAPVREPEVGDEEDSTEEEDEVDAETRRKLELRERMAKMSGGMGMAGMFGAPLPMPSAAPKKKKQSIEGRNKDIADDAISPQVPRMPMIPIAGMSAGPSSREQNVEPEEAELAVGKEPEPRTSTHIVEDRQPEEVPDVEDIKPQPPMRASLDERRSHPVPTQERHLPPLTSNEVGVEPPPLPTGRPGSSGMEGTSSQPAPHSESEDETSAASHELPLRAPPPPVPGSVARTPSIRPASYFESNPTSPQSPSATSPGEKRISRQPPPIPTSPIVSQPSSVTRPPPPPPPTAAPPTRQSTTDTIPARLRENGDDDTNEEETEYEGDYDTDIASGATHRDALKSHARESSTGGSTTTDSIARSPPLPSAPPPIPQNYAPRAVPPPPPHQAPPKRQSLDAPRAAPPPIPPARPPVHEEDEVDYDPYRYSGAGAPLPRMAPPLPSAPAPPPVPARNNAESDDDEDDLYSSPPARPSVDRRPPPPQDRSAPPAPTQMYSQQPPGPAPGVPSARPRQSLDVDRNVVLSRRSTDQARPPGDHSFIAREADLGAGSQWWAQPNTPPPIFQNRKDVLFEVEENRTSEHSGKTIVSKDVYVLFQDYSQTVINVRFNARDVSEVTLDQKHKPPPGQLRQDQLEEAHGRFGRQIHQGVSSKQNTIVADGTPQGLISELLRPYSSALPPVGTRAYGALVYANLANASTQQFDEIRPGDVLTIRNAKFEGKHGPMHAKYKMEVGKPDHVAIVDEWDGTKKKVKAWEQGRENKKVKLESFRVGDLRSGEVKVWRVMGRSWVGWDDGN